MNDTSETLAIEGTSRALAAGQVVFQRFRLERVLGRGGMGVVWLAHDEKLEEAAALKFLPETVRLDSTAVDELKRETRKSRQLTHPNIVRIHDFVEDATGAAIVMEYINGHTLAEKRLEKPFRAFEPEEIRDWMLQVCEALEYAHREAKIVHRDLKPANIMVSATGRVKITDFGIARSISDSISRMSAFQPRSGSGSPPFMSPQQANGEPATPLDDIYGLGSTIYDLLTGKPPFYTGDIFRQIETRTAPSVTERRRELQLSMASVPQEWESLVADCLAKDTASRPQSAAEVIVRLRERGKKPGSPAGGATGAHSGAPKRAIWIGAGVVVVGAILVLFAMQLFLLRSIKTGPETTGVRPPEPALASSLPIPKESAEVSPGGVAPVRAPVFPASPSLQTGETPVPPGVAISGEPAKEAAPAGKSDENAIAWTKLGKMHAEGDGVPKNDAEAAKYFRMAADQGNAEAQAKLGELYADGNGVEKSDAEAAKWFRLSADQGNALGEGNLGALYANGQGVEKNDGEAVRLLRLAADKGNAEALMNLGVLSLSGREGNGNDAVKWFRMAAELGNARAQFKLGRMFSEGSGTEKNYAEAAKYFRMAADQGNPDAQSHLGAMYLSGLGMPASDAKALKLFESAADQGNADAQFSLGLMYANGRGVAKSSSEAAKWYRLAAAQGNVRAQKKLKELDVPDEADPPR
ncbi:MAG: protein kinase [Verrucomicrobiae bacterium]